MLKYAGWMVIALLILIGGLVLSSVGVSFGGWIALAALALLLLLGFFSPWPWSPR
jgi:hypothetical protein